MKHSLILGEEVEVLQTSQYLLLMRCGFEAQTFECIEILKARKTPFIVAVNKIDRIPGWKAEQGKPFLQSYTAQSSFVQEEFNNRLYNVMGDFSRLGSN
jgi:translation initiation factor 5B